MSDERWTVKIAPHHLFLTPIIFFSSYDIGLSDIFLHLGKFGKFWRSEWLAGIAWAAFVSSYVLFRLFYYPQIVISVWTDSEIHLRMPPLEHLFFSVALSLLQVLHLVWFGFIVRSVARSIQSGQWTDARGEQDKDA
jgi:hypothetical protein